MRVKGMSYTLTSLCLAEGTMTLTPSLECLLREVPPVALVGGERYPLVVDRGKRVVRGLSQAYAALGVEVNDRLLLTPTQDGLLVKAVARAPRPRKGAREGAPPVQKEERTEPPRRARRVVRLFPGGREEEVLLEEGGTGEAPGEEGHLLLALEVLSRLGFVAVHRGKGWAALASEVGPLLLYASPPSPPPGSVAYAHLGEGPGPRISPEALEALRRHPVRPHQLLGRLEGTLEAKASLTALLLHLAEKRPGESLSREEAEEVAPGSSSLLGVLEAPPSSSWGREGKGTSSCARWERPCGKSWTTRGPSSPRVEKRVPQGRGPGGAERR